MSRKLITVKVDGDTVADFPLGTGGDRRGFDSTGYRAARDWSARYHGTGKTVEIKVPAVGESITEGTLARWLKKDGDVVRADEPLFELETEKATTDVAAPADGQLRITVREGQTVTIGTVVGYLEPAASAIPASVAPAATAVRRAR